MSILSSQEENEVRNYLLQVAEALIINSGLPKILQNKYFTIKEIALNKLQKTQKSVQKSGKDQQLQSLSQSFSNSQQKQTTKKQFQAEFLENQQKLSEENLETQKEKQIFQKKVVDFYQKIIDVIFQSYLVSCEKMKDLMNFKGGEEKKKVQSVEESKEFSLQSILSEAKDLEKVFQIEDQSLENYLNGHLKNLEICENIINQAIDSVEGKLQNQHFLLIKFKDRVTILDQNESLLRKEVEQMKKKFTLHLNGTSTLSSGTDLFKITQELNLLKEENEHFHLNQTIQNEENIIQMKEKLVEIEFGYQQQLQEIQEEMQQRDKSLSEIFEYFEQIKFKYQQAFESYQHQISKENIDQINVRNNNNNQARNQQQNQQNFQYFPEDNFQNNQNFYNLNNNSVAKQEMAIHEIIHFFVYVLQKFEDDNTWLLDRLTEFGQQNEELRNQIIILKNDFIKDNFAQNQQIPTQKYFKHENEIPEINSQNETDSPTQSQRNQYLQNGYYSNQLNQNQMQNELEINHQNQNISGNQTSRQIFQKTLQNEGFVDEIEQTFIEMQKKMKENSANKRNRGPSYQ